MPERLEIQKKVLSTDTCIYATQKDTMTEGQRGYTKALILYGQPQQE